MFYAEPEEKDGDKDIITPEAFVDHQDYSSCTILEELSIIYNMLGNIESKLS